MKQQSDINQMEIGLITKSLEEVMHDSMIPYTEHVVMDRALPRVEDGLKPVQRRILYTMYEDGLFPDKPFRKSATVVGDCLGRYHPHGDTSVYDAMVRMAQDFMLREPLVEGHGNFGSIDGDSAAAYRYTEAKLKPLALELLKDIDKNTVNWGLNFDDRLKEPDTLPGRFPNMLVNGAYGIAVGLATNIPPHNLSETIDAVCAYIDKPSITLDGLMKHIKGPDFPTGGLLIVGDEFKKAYETGKGKIIIRAKAFIEDSGDKKNIVITELPYQTNKAQLLQKIAELKEENKEKYSAIAEIRDESDRNGMRAVIRIKKEGNAKAILESLYRQTGLQVTFGINMTAIAGGKPKCMSLLEIISYYVEYQRQVVYRRTKFDLDVCKDRAHILEGLLIAIKNIDEVIKIIKKSQSTNDAKTSLKEKFFLSEKQAQAILDMRLARLVNLEVNKIKDELAELKAKIAELTEVYNSKSKQLNVVKTELLDIKKQYKSPRRSKIVGEDDEEVVEETTEEDLIADKDLYIAVSHNNTVKAIPDKNYNLANKEFTETSTFNDLHFDIIKAKSSDNLLVLTNKGNCLKILAKDIPEAKYRDRGTDFNKLDKNIEKDEKIVKVLNITKPEFELAQAELVFMTKFGMVKKSPLADYMISKSYFQAIKLGLKDEVISAGEFTQNTSILMITNNGMVLNFENDIPLTGRISGGVRGINLEDADFVIYANQIKKQGAITVLTSKGYAKNVPIGEFEISARYRKGLRIFNPKDCGETILATFGVVPPSFIVKEDGGLRMLKSIYIPYDNRTGKGKQIYKEEIKKVVLYN